MPARLLKLYIDSTSLPLVHQMADFVRCADDPAITKLITWLRLPLSEAQLAGTGALYLPQMAAISSAFVGQVCHLVKQGHRDIEIHSNQYHAWRGVAPLLQALAPVLRSGAVRVRLHLYDDRSVRPLQREELARWPDLSSALAVAARELEAHLFSRQPLSWTLPHSHAWPLVLPTTFHWLHPKALLRTPEGAALCALLDEHIQPMVFDGLPGLTQAQSDHYLALFGLTAEVADTLVPLAGAADAVLFTGTGTWDKAWNLRLRDSQLRAIATLHQHHCFDGLRAMGYKGHPANGDHDAAIQAALGDDVIALPQRVPLEVLLMAGLLPQRVAGVLSTFHLTMPAAMIDAVLCQAGPPPGGTSAPLVQWLIDNQLVAPEQMLALLD